jgi:hypothetical protein
MPLKFSIDKRYKNYRLSIVMFSEMHVGRLMYKTGPGQKHKILAEK